MAALCGEINRKRVVLVSLPEDYGQSLFTAISIARKRTTLKTGRFAEFTFSVMRQVDECMASMFCSVIPYPVPEGRSGQQVVDSLQRQVELLGAVKSGIHSVDCETYQSNIQNFQRTVTVNVLHNSEQPATSFGILDTGTSLVADHLFDCLMNKLKGVYQQKKGAKIEARGQRYEFGDFIIKIGSVSMGPNFRGLLFEVEYCPCSVPGECWNLIKEFMSSIVGNLVDTPPQYLKSRIDQIYTPVDTINQYLEHFNNFRKSAPTQQQMR